MFASGWADEAVIPSFFLSEEREMEGEDRGSEREEERDAERKSNLLALIGKSEWQTSNSAE